MVSVTQGMREGRLGLEKRNLHCATHDPICMQPTGTRRCNATTRVLVAAIRRGFVKRCVPRRYQDKRTCGACASHGVSPRDRSSVWVSLAEMAKYIRSVNVKCAWWVFFEVVVQYVLVLVWISVVCTRIHNASCEEVAM